MPGAVGPDDSDDPALREVEAQVIEEELVAEGLLHALGAHDDVAEARARRDVDLVRLAPCLDPALGDELLVGLEARLALGLPRARRHPHPLELALEGALACALRLLLDLEPGFLLLEPRGVVALPRDPRAAVQLEDPARDVVEEVAVVRDGHDRARELLQKLLEPGDGLGVEMVRRLVEEKHVRAREEEAAERDAALFAARDLRDVRVGRRAAQGVHRGLEGPVQLPAIRSLDRVLHLAVLGHDLVHLGLG